MKTFLPTILILTITTAATALGSRAVSITDNVQAVTTATQNVICSLQLFEQSLQQAQHTRDLVPVLFTAGRADGTITSGVSTLSNLSTLTDNECSTLDDSNILYNMSQALSDIVLPFFQLEDTIKDANQSCAAFLYSSQVAREFAQFFTALLSIIPNDTSSSSLILEIDSSNATVTTIAQFFGTKSCSNSNSGSY